MRIRFTSILCGFATLTMLTSVFAVPSALAAVSRELEEDHQLSLEFETPHTKWAKPYAGGITRVLFFTDGHGTNPRHAIEVMQRFDLKAEAVFWATVVDSPVQHWLGDEAGVARMKKLLSQPWDCFVFMGIPPERMPVEEQYMMLKAVSKGAGIVLIGTGDRRILKENRREAELPEFLATGTPFNGLSYVRDGFLKDVSEENATEALAASRMVAAYKVKDGRGVSLPGPPNVEYRPGWDTEYEYWSQLVGRALLWATGKQPALKLRVTTSRSAFGRQNLPQSAITVSYENLGDPRPLAFHLSLRRYDGFTTSLAEQRMPKTVTRPGKVYAFTRTIPVLRAGRYFVDVIATSNGGVEAWGSTSFGVASSRKVEAVQLAKSWGEIGETLSGEVKLSGSRSTGHETVRVDLCDRRNRVLARQEVGEKSGAISFHFALQPWMPMLLRVDAVLMDKDREVADGCAYFNLTQRHRGKFNFVMWDIPRGLLAPYAEESLARLGVTVHLAGGTPPKTVAAYDIAWVPYTTRLQSPKDTNGYMLPTCWNHESDITNYVRSIVQPHAGSRQHGVFVYSLGDEGVTRGACLHPDCLAAYRRYLAGEYGAIEALNLSWQTHFESFDQVTLDPPDDNEAGEAKRMKNYPRWYDRQAYQCANFAGYCKRFVEEFAKLDPQAKVGFEGAGSFDQGDDYDLIVRTNGFWSPYPGLGDEIIRSLAPREFPRSNWMGYTKDADSLLSKYWRMITRGNDSVWWWRWDCIGAFHGFLAPHLGPYAAVREIANDTKVVRDGLGTLLIKSKMQEDGIAILYSMPSAYATQVEQGPAYGNYSQTHEAWSRTIRELGLQYRYVTDRMLRLGEFDSARCKVLILARTEAIGPKEAEVLRGFVQSGGTLIADLRPGIYDGHCKPRTSGVLDDLFGITRSAVNDPPATGTAALKIGAKEVEIEKTAYDPAVQEGSGLANGFCRRAPLMVTRQVGKGRAVLLNFNLSTFPGLGNERTPELAVDLFRQLFASSGVQPQIAVTGNKGARMRNLEIVRWLNGDTELLALFRESGQPEEATVNLPEARYVYDLRHHAFVGNVKTFPTKIIASRATFFALSPQAVPLVEVLPYTLTPTRGSVLKADVRVPGSGSLKAVRLKALLPNGKPADWLNSVVMVDRKGATASLPIAYNDPPGKWTLVATELYTNKATTSTFVVR